MAIFPGVHVAIITPFTEKREVDVERLREHADWLIREGIHGLIPSGTCGEYASLTEPERATVVETVIEAAAGRVPVIVGCAAPTTERALHWARHAQQSGASGLMALPPINYRPTQREVIAYYETLATVGLPMIAYNNPFDTATDLTPAVLNELAHIDKLVGVKEFSGDVRRIPEILEKTRFEVLAGADDLSLEGLLAGATGWIAGLTNVLPRESVQMYELARAGNVAQATALYRRLLPLFRYDSTPRLVQAIKHALAVAGRPVGDTRPPRLSLDEADRIGVEQAYARAVQI